MCGYLRSPHTSIISARFHTLVSLPRSIFQHAGATQKHPCAKETFFTHEPHNMSGQCPKPPALPLHRPIPHPMPSHTALFPAMPNVPPLNPTCRAEGVGGGGQSLRYVFALVNSSVENFAETPGFCVVNFADTPRTVVVCWALRAWRSLATGATHNAGETHLPHSASDEGPVGLRS